jgi:hypothetical protein
MLALWGSAFEERNSSPPGVRLNVNKRSVGLTFGPRGARYSVNTSGRRTASFGIPGTGVYYRTEKGGGRRRSPAYQTQPTFNSDTLKGFAWGIATILVIVVIAYVVIFAVRYWFVMAPLIVLPLLVWVFLHMAKVARVHADWKRAEELRASLSGTRVKST